MARIFLSETKCYHPLLTELLNVKKGGRKIEKGRILSWSWPTVPFFHWIFPDIKCKFYLGSMNHYLNILMCILFLIDKLHLLEFILFTLIDWLITYISTSNGKVIGFMNYSFVGWRVLVDEMMIKNKTAFLIYLVGLPALEKKNLPPLWRKQQMRNFFLSLLRNTVY